jgi:hypothetical protein
LPTSSHPKLLEAVAPSASQYAMQFSSVVISVVQPRIGSPVWGSTPSHEQQQTGSVGQVGTGSHWQVVQLNCWPSREQFIGCLRFGPQPTFGVHLKQGPPPRAPRFTHSPRSGPGGKAFVQNCSQAVFPPGAAHATPGTEANTPPRRALPIHLSALRLVRVPLASPLANSSKEVSIPGPGLVSTTPLVPLSFAIRPVPLPLHHFPFHRYPRVQNPGSWFPTRYSTNHRSVGS